MSKEVAREIILNTLNRLEDIPSGECKKICDKLFCINSKHDLGLYHQIKFHLVKDNPL